MRLYGSLSSNTVITLFQTALCVGIVKELSLIHIFRTGDIYSPFPEEMNRKLTGSIATYHFAPTSSSESNLKKENINTEHLYVTGNTVIAVSYTHLDVYKRQV